MRSFEAERPGPPVQQPHPSEPVVQIPEPPSERDPFPETEPAVMPYAPTDLDLTL
jgi:hypothetical protein